MKKCIILANGKPPRKKVITFSQKNGYETLICADGGANSALKLGLIPYHIIGDLDSISKAALDKFKSRSNIINYKRQSDTDVENCLKFVIKNKFKEVLLIGVTGNRLDHTFCNLGIVLKFFHQINISLIAENSFLKPYKGKQEIKTFKGETISLYGFDRRTKITSKGLKYPLKNISLPFGEKESTSNIATSNLLRLNISNGVIFIIRDFNRMKKYDLFKFD
ncbi:MAG: thiamine diphosphokinase [Ignavibacteriaceae bacterium]|nr:thiamine diphosphokinase [Ignavibacteriaceae bacterium]